MQALSTDEEGALGDVRPDERTGRRDSLDHIIMDQTAATGQSPLLVAPQEVEPQQPQPPQPPLDSTIHTTNQLIRMHMNWKPSSTPTNPVVAYLKSMTTKTNAGWLRVAEATAAGRVWSPDPHRKPHLTPHEKKLLANLYTHIKHVTDTTTALVAHAWGVAPATVSRIVKRMIASTDLSVARKVRADAGQTIFNSDAKRKSTYTPRFCFLQMQRQQHPGMRAEELEELWRQASPETKARAEQESKKLLQRGPFLLNEVHEVLSKTNGSISWRQLTTQVSGGAGQVRPFSDRTAREFVKARPPDASSSSYNHSNNTSTTTTTTSRTKKQSTEKRTKKKRKLP